jgi:CDP-diacylglycerol---glycerol-3-phosphate 3-phosphatidyltransferase
MKNVPNLLSFSRILTTVVIFILILVNQPWAFLAATVLFLLASITDLLDGYLARKYALISSLGIFLDLTADKIFVSAILVALVQLGLVPAWVVFIIITREFLVTGARTVASAKGKIIPAGKWGKQKTFITLLGTGGVLLAKGFGGQRLSLFPLMLNFSAQSLAVSDFLLLTADILLILAVIWTVLSGAEYLLSALPIFASEPQRDAMKS